MEKRGTGKIKKGSRVHSFLFNKKFVNSKRSQAGIITIVLIILIVIVAVVIIWNVVIPLVKEKSKGVQVDSFITDLTIGKASVGSLETSKITLTRGSSGELDGIKFVFYDDEGKTAFEDRTDVLGKLETKDYYFSPFGNLSKIVKIEVYPIINNNLGMKGESQLTKELSPYLSLSWKTGEIKPTNEFIFNNKIGISFWVNGNDNKNLLSQGSSYEIKIDNAKIIFSYGGNNFTSSNDLTLGKNHVVVSIGQVSTMYINNQYSGASNSFNDFASSGALTIGEIDNLMIFNKSLDLNSVSGLYNSQLE